MIKALLAVGFDRKAANYVTNILLLHILYVCYNIITVNSFSLSQTTTRKTTQVSPSVLIL